MRGHVCAFLALASLVLASPGAAPAASAAPVVIWTDATHAAAVGAVAHAWAATSGTSVRVVVKDLDKIESTLGTVASAHAPDVIFAAHDWTGELASSGLVEPLYPSRAISDQFPLYALNGFSYGTTVKKLYGIPTQVENVGLVVNTGLAAIPTTFAQLEATALRFKKRNHLAFGICVQQGSGGDAYHMYPFFSGLGGYVFGRNGAGNLDPANLGVAGKSFLANARLIDRWNKEGLLNSKLDYTTCDTAFTHGKTPFWITGPWALADIRKARIAFRVVQLPPIARRSVPFVSLDGLMVTKYASEHGVDAAAKDLVTNDFSRPEAQTELAAAGGRAPASTRAKPASPTLAEFAAAARGGVPLPNIPQMTEVWGALSLAWARSTSGHGAVPAAKAFRDAAREIAKRIK